jgi:hypothetical protein
MELLVIDEVSMLRADLLDAMDYMMQPFEKRLFWWCASIVYLLQLPPVLETRNGAAIITKENSFFTLHVVQQSPP